MAERRGELVAMRGQVDSVEPGSADEPSVEIGGGVGDPGQGAMNGRLQQGGGPTRLSEHRTGYPERHRCLQGPGRRVIADRRAEPPEHRGKDVVASPAYGAVGIAR